MSVMLFSMVHSLTKCLCSNHPVFQDSTKPTYVCHLHKSLYGLKQAIRAWYEKLQGALSSLGFIGSQNDHSLFVKKTPTLVFVLVYVDDILVTGPSSQVCKEIIAQLSTLFPIKDLGPLHFFLGIEVKKVIFWNSDLLDQVYSGITQES